MKGKKRRKEGEKRKEEGLEGNYGFELTDRVLVSRRVGIKRLWGYFIDKLVRLYKCTK